MTPDRPSSRLRSIGHRLVAAPFLGMIWLYRFTLSPFIGGHCRFFPSCSLYAIDAYRTHNVVRATSLTIERLLRCHPWGGRGYDPVPGTEPPSDHPIECAHACSLASPPKVETTSPDKNAPIGK